MAMGHQLKQRRHREVRRAHEDQTKGHFSRHILERAESLFRHGRACPDHPRLCPTKQKVVDARDKPGHDDRMRVYSAARLAALENFFSTRSRLSLDRGSTNSTPLRWSISCWMQVANRPSASSSCTLPSRSVKRTRTLAGRSTSS